MKINAVKLHISTAAGNYGFNFKFGRQLTVVRGRNSAGKSTLFNTILYSLGMEELVGGRDENVLPYGVRDHFLYEGNRQDVLTSEVFAEIENDMDQVVTLRRAIKHPDRQPKLIEVFEGKCLTGDASFENSKPTYIHDAGAAQKDEGFHRFMEKFLGLRLPTVPTSSGGEAKLYLQTIVAAHAVEQKRGWTDYIATIPFYGIREVRTKVVEYLLGLDVFDTDALKNRLNSESVKIHENWTKYASEVSRAASGEGFVVIGLPGHPDSSFNMDAVNLFRKSGDRQLTLPQYRTQLRDEYRALDEKIDNYSKVTSDEAVIDLETLATELRELNFLHEQSITQLTLKRASHREYEELLLENRESLARNRTAQKLKGLGGDYSLELAEDRCPTCLQDISETLLGGTITGPVMSLDENIAYLKNQCSMLERQIAGFKTDIEQSERISAELGRRLAAKSDHLKALRGDVSTGAVQSKAMIRRQVQLETQVDRIADVDQLIRDRLPLFCDLALQLGENQKLRAVLPKERYAETDQLKINMFEKWFRSNAGSFGYESAPIRDIEISRDTLTPVLGQLELREINKKKTDIKADSSASDFVRLIWSYLLAIYQTSASKEVNGNHLGILLFDEPGQHSMRVESQHSLLQLLAAESGLQSIVAASFDESDSVFNEATSNVKYELIEWGDKLIQPLRST
ncbi:hypothetical protein O0881_08350 [Janthinobacterium sp. SUN100]|uniref:hypothetical protein n=1 Tax=Janthinobacterium sp. SUN100 TaxID=3004101 RepID=UPI0025AF466A|nr:hypothetical protein [Janthinobacterium sp. SUN100]MDN2702002.1 hypothetical protein [Janthinobacterium sp. SUN100]